MKACSPMVLPATAALATLLAGCGHTETHAAMLRAPQSSPSQPVELYVVDQAVPTRPYYDIAIVQAIGFGNDANPEDIARALTEKAASLGCDAVIRVSFDVGYSRAHGAGVCVKYLAPGPAGPAPILPPNPRANPTPPPMRPAPAPRIEPLPSAPLRGR